MSDTKKTLNFKNVNYINDMIISDIQSEQKDIPKLNNDLKEYKIQLRIAYDEDETRVLKQKIDILEQKINNLQEDSELSLYKLKSKDKFVQYNDILNKPKYNNSNRNDDTQYNDILNNMFTLFEQYFTDIEYVNYKSTQQNIVCNNCQRILNDEYKTTDYYECVCGNMIKIKSSIIIQDDNNNNGLDTYNFGKEKTFLTKLDDFEGKCTKDIPPREIINKIKCHYKNRINIDIISFFIY